MASLASKIKDWLEARGCIVRKNHGSRYSVVGEPDIDVWYYRDGMHYAIPFRIEVKRSAKDEPRPAQIERMRKARAHGIRCYVVWELGQLEEIFREVQSEAEQKKGV